jgi:hypothetical protein
MFWVTLCCETLVRLGWSTGTPQCIWLNDGSVDIYDILLEQVCWNWYDNNQTKDKNIIT